MKKLLIYPTMLLYSCSPKLATEYKDSQLIDQESKELYNDFIEAMKEFESDTFKVKLPNWLNYEEHIGAY